MCEAYPTSDRRPAPLGARPAVQLRTPRRGVFGKKTATTDAQLVQVSVTGALLVTNTPIPDVEVGSRMDIVLQGRPSIATVRRVVVHHDMALYGVELRQIDAWMQALIDRAIPRRAATSARLGASLTNGQCPGRGPGTVTSPVSISLGATDADALREQLAVVRGIAEEELGRLRPLEVEVRGVLPREADAAVDLDVLGRRVEVRLGAVRLGQRRDRRATRR